MNSQTFVGQEITQARAATFIDLIYETQTDYISVSTMTNVQWQAFCKASGRENLLDDPRFATPALRDQNANERLELIQEALLERPAAEWLEILDKAGVPSAPVLTRAQMIQHEQVEASGSVVEYDHPQAGRLRQARPAARFESTPAEIKHGAPALGTHTREVLAEVGYSDADIDALTESGVLLTK
jgi:crotonobetainyl-CoA:carnitine CoA-transferase CaiB-like acyl-CoA transferase